MSATDPIDFHMLSPDEQAALERFAPPCAEVSHAGRGRSQATPITPAQGELLARAFGAFDLDRLSQSSRERIEHGMARYDAQHGVAE